MIKLLPASELRRLRTGSYEDRIESAAAALRGHFGDRAFEIISTRDNGTVVFSEGAFQLIRLEASEAVVTDLRVEVFDHTNASTFIEREASTIVSLFMEGATDIAISRLRALVPAVPQTPQVDALLAISRPWLRLFEERRDSIIDFIGGEMASIESDLLRRKLYDEPINVAESLESLIDRLGKIRSDVESVLILEAESSEPIFDLFGRFATDLFDDLQILHEVSSNVMTTAKDAHDRSKLYDSLIEGLRDREIASCFVVTAANRMVEAS